MSESKDYTVPTKFKAAVARWGDRVAMRKKEFGLWHDITWNEYDRNVCHFVTEPPSWKRSLSGTPRVCASSKIPWS